VKRVLLALLVGACASAPPPRPLQMRAYGFVLLRRGPAWTPDDTSEVRRLSEGHMANIQALGRAGKLVLAGPFGTDPAERDGLAGLFVFEMTSADEIRAALAADPAIQAGRFVPEIMEWYGPAGLTYDGRDATP
jgi:uncharacterized protein YciI